MADTMKQDNKDAEESGRPVQLDREKDEKDEKDEKSGKKDQNQDVPKQGGQQHQGGQHQPGGGQNR